MAEKIRYCFVIGSSRGLGASLVKEFIGKEGYSVIGISRTDNSKILNYDNLVSTGRYRYLELDITSPDCIKTINAVCSELPKEPICVIFNAARVESDIREDFSIDCTTFKEINRVGVDGLGNTLNAFESHLLNYGGIFVGISSFSALIPPVFEQRVAYPASKAYLDMALRCLRFTWKDKVRVVTVHLGHLDSLGDGKRYWFVPNYEQTARKITKVLGQENIPNEINYPFLYNLLYRRLFIFVPDKVYYWAINLLTKIMPEQKK